MSRTKTWQAVCTQVVTDRFRALTVTFFHLLNPNSCLGAPSPVSLQVWETGFIMTSTPNTNTTQTDACVGIDVAKASLDIFAENNHQTWSVKNEPKQFAALIKRLQALAPQRIIVEASGGYETNLVVALASAGLPVCLVNPKRVRDFAKGVGQLAKTDQLDARLLAFFGRVVAPPLYALETKEQQELAALTQRRRQLLEMLVSERNRLENAPPLIAKSLRQHIKWLEKQLASTDADLDQKLRETEMWRRQDELLQSVPGVGQSWRPPV